MINKLNLEKLRELRKYSIDKYNWQTHPEARKIYYKVWDRIRGIRQEC